MENGKKKLFVCRNCSKSWADYISNDKNKQFCSVVCKSQFARTDRTCKNCFKIFSICKSVLRTNATGNYCSRTCYVAKMTTGLTKNKNGFRTISERIRRAKPRCGVCGTQNRIHIHHIEPYRYTKNNSFENLIPLCISHHKVVEIETEKLAGIDNPSRAFLMMKIMLRSRQQLMLSLTK